MSEPATVLYNAECPICSREVDAYRRAAEASGSALRFETLTEGAPERHGLTRDEAARRLHVVRDGELLSGADAFRALWAELPRTRWLARLTGLPGVRQATGLLYDRLAAPVLYMMHRRRTRRRV
jgi:predicted DCC family thiol-disulfide oxidoreductase YuxK